MILLALDTSTDLCSVALWHENSIDTIEQVAPQQHAVLILDMVKALLVRHQLTIKDCTAIAFGAGPGSFTGLRIATAVAQGLAFAHALPLIPVSTLAALAYQAKKSHSSLKTVASVLDARMQEVYLGCYEVTEEIPVLLFPETLVKFSEVSSIAMPFLSAPWAAVGTELNAFPELFQLNAKPTAETIAYLAKEALAKGQVVNVAHAMPHYVRQNVAQASKN